MVIWQRTPTVLLSGAVLLAVATLGCRSVGLEAPSPTWLTAARTTYAKTQRMQLGADPLPWCAEAGVFAGGRNVEGRTQRFRFVSQAADSGNQAGAASQHGPTSRAATAPAVNKDYWRSDVLRQAGHEARDVATRGLWRGFKTSYWDIENAAILTAALGASITLRETGVDDAIRRRTDGHRQLGDFDEPIQLLGHPATHFAGAGALWLTSALTRDEKQHELAKSLGQALIVNGVSTLLLKSATNTTGPDGDGYAWPSGHTSSAFTTAAVLNEYYGPWVGVPSLALAGLVGYQRIDSRSHDFSDVVFGATLGFVIGRSIARDNKEAAWPELFGMQVVPFADPQTGASGLALMKSW